MKEEIWKSIEGFEVYQISNFGKVKRLAGPNSRGHWLNERLLCLNAVSDFRKCLGISLCVNGTKTYKSVHRLVAEAFLPNPDNLPHVNHKDSDRLNNHVDNLEWVRAQNYTNNENQSTRLHMNGTKHAFTNLTENQILKIRQLYSEGYTYSQLSQIFSLSHHVIIAIIQREN